ncbi:MAG: flagellin [Candidatus Aureabacteria bacterium]|nr:flagellin [Candidatus Auribacterota bacterium]
MGDLARVNTNVAALRAFFTLSEINDRIAISQKRISTGIKVNSASDDPAIYFAIKKTRRDIAALANKELNIERGINFLETNSSKLDQVSELLLEMYTLANTAQAGGVSSAEKQAIQTDIIQLQQEIENIMQSGVSASIYSGFTIGGLENVSLTGTTTAGTPPTLVNLTIDTTNLLVTGTSDVGTAINNIKGALDAIVKDNQKLGSYVRRLRFEIDDARSEKADLQATLSTIQDADIAEEQLELTKLQILQQSALAMLAQANAAPQAVLVLFQ